ncbi:MAG TPA: Tad domain-containing protein, partial [Armatimonadota bacterium]|nr:Tad domain-containing protein [Armatimonadota bacterium]
MLRISASLIQQGIRHRNGQILVLAALGMVLFFGFLGLVIDVGRLYVVRQQLRNACDAGAGAGAAKLPESPSDCRQYAIDYYCRNVRASTVPSSSGQETNGANNFYLYTVTVADGSTDTVRVAAPYNGDDHRVYVSAQRNVASVFMQLLGHPVQPVGAYAVGREKGRSTYASLLVSNGSAGATLPTEDQHVRLTENNTPDPAGSVYAMVLTGNNMKFGYNDQGEQVGAVVSAQNIYYRGQNSQGLSLYGDNQYLNDLYSTGGGNNPDDGLLHPTYQDAGGGSPINPDSYSGIPFTTKSANDPLWDSNHAIDGNYYVNGDLTIGGNNREINGYLKVDGNLVITANSLIGTATLLVKGSITFAGNKCELTALDSTNHLAVYAGFDPEQFANPTYSPDSNYVRFDGNSATITGSVYAPFGCIETTAHNNLLVRGTLASDSMVLDGNNIE